MFSFALAENETLNDSVIMNETNVSISLNETINVTNVSTASIAIKNFLPMETKKGDVQLSINVQNLKSETINEVYAYVSGDGFSSYSVVPIDSLKPDEKSYILVSGNFKKAGSINLTIKVNQETFYQVVNVLDDSASSSVYNAELASNLSKELSALKNDYAELESDVQTKKSEGYDVSGVVLSDLKVMLRDAQANLLSENLIQTKVKIDLAREEYLSQSVKMNNLSKISLAAKLKDNAVLFSTLAGAIITFFTLYELLKRKKEHLHEKIKSINIKDKAGNQYSVQTSTK
jgi:hypothetical protein